MKSDPLETPYLVLIERHGHIPLAWLLRHSPEGDVAAAIVNAWNASTDPTLMRAIVTYAIEKTTHPAFSWKDLFCYECYQFGIKSDCRSCVVILIRNFDASKLAVIAPRLLGMAVTG